MNWHKDKKSIPPLDFLTFENIDPCTCYGRLSNFTEIRIAKIILCTPRRLLTFENFDHCTSYGRLSNFTEISIAKIILCTPRCL